MNIILDANEIKTETVTTSEKEDRINTNSNAHMKTIKPDDVTETPLSIISNSHPPLHVFPAAARPIYVFSNQGPIRSDHMTAPIPVPFVHPSFCYPPFIPYDALLPSQTLPKEQIPPVNNLITPHNLIHNGKTDMCTRPLAVSTNTVSSTKPAATPKILQQHLVIEKGKEKKYECHVCKSTFSLQRLLNRHLNTHSFHKRYQCSYCDKGFNDTFDLKRHVRTHTGIKPFKCNLCDKAFTQRCSLEAHKTRVHGVIYQYGFRERRAKLFVCEDCGETFQDSGDYMKHLQDKHPESATKTRFKRSYSSKITKVRQIEMETN